MAPEELIVRIAKGYGLTVLLETPILVLALSRQHPLRRRIAAGLWLTGCSYPVVTLLLPHLFTAGTYMQYVITAEVFAPVSECFLFWSAYHRDRSFSKREILRDFLCIVCANLISFSAGWLLMHNRVKIF